MGRVKDKLANVIPILDQNPKAKEILRVMPNLICFDLEGEGGKFYVVISEEQMKLEEETCGEPDIIVSGDANEVAKIIAREREITHPVAEGKVWISKGKLSQMILFDRVLALQPKAR